MTEKVAQMRPRWFQNEAKILQNGVYCLPCRVQVDVHRGTKNTVDIQQIHNLIRKYFVRKLRRKLMRRDRHRKLMRIDRHR